MPETIEADACIVGAGIAGLFAALSLPEAFDVVVLDQGTIGQGSSPFAQGGMAVAVGRDDSPERHADDTVAAGAGLVDLRACEVLTREAPARLLELIELGCRFDRYADGTLHIAREGGQSVARSVHRADATGAEIVRALRLAARPRVRRVEGFAAHLAVVNGACRGVWATVGSGAILVRAPVTLLATGGAGGLFASTTNPPASIGSGNALGAAAGARLADLEFVQFHPTALAVAESPRPLITEALRGAGAHLVDGAGRRFMTEIHPDAELAPRHVVTAAIFSLGRAFLDARHLGAARLEEEFPTVLASCRGRGFDLAAEPVPVAPAAHYAIGGVATGLDGRTSIPGLLAAGECAATGVHGANRMAGNSLAETVVFGGRAALSMTRDAAAIQPDGDPEWEAEPIGSAPSVQTPTLRQRIVEAVTMGAGPVRDAASATKGIRLLDELGEELGPGLAAGRTSSEQGMMVRAGRLLIRAALARAETRGVHVRAEFPGPDPALDGVHLTWSS
jgi:L-aspartate oxidase